jgi:hypothetical protein
MADKAMKVAFYSAIFSALLLATSVRAEDAKSKPFVPPADAQWTIICEVFDGPNHQAQARAAKDYWLQHINMPGFYIVHEEDHSTLYYGYYRSIDNPKDHRESDRAQADRQRLRQLADPTGQHPFLGSIFVELVPKDPPAPSEWNLVNAKGYWSLQVAVYEDDPRRKEAAVDSVQEMRAHGIQAYYYHGPTASSVCIGLWPREAVQQEQPSRPANPNEPVLVSNRPMEGNGEVYLRSTGQRVQEITPQVKIVDPTLLAMMRQYPYEAINGEMEVRDADGHLVKGPTPSYVVEVPHEQKPTTSPAEDSSQLPSAFLPPPPPPSDSTANGLRSIDSK